jgi:hypothetical protein
MEIESIVWDQRFPFKEITEVMKRPVRSCIELDHHYKGLTSTGTRNEYSLAEREYNFWA